MPFNLCLGRRRRGPAGRQFLPPEVIEELARPLKRQRSTRSTRSTASRRRQHDDTCTTCLRGTLHCYNVCILIIGCGALGVGVWLLVTDFGARNVTPIVGNQLYEVTTYLLIAGGGAVALLAFCGCCGTIREDKCVLSFYGTTLAIVLILLCIACGLAFFFRGVIADHIRGRMKNTLAINYGVDVRTNTENRRITESWDSMQRQLQCCGVAGNTTSDEAWVFYSTQTQWNKKELQKPERRMVPESCCAKGDIHLCTGLKPFDGPPIFYKGHLEQHREINPYLYTTGCYDKLIDYLKTYSAVVGCVAAVVPIFLVLGIIVSFCLCARVAGITSDEADV
ncbi:tetraspanin-18-like isoform X1 [Pomacea canaliculata]|uniref:tetraspanin-18-like isoform X1 n=1 Tax=Pomacea canaliculata TaxID=400727 RepID=UPI000D730F62|nr:tetraspanin-18-like isoform X1 [Pomacea canaliculata]